MKYKQLSIAQKQAIKKVIDTYDIDYNKADAYLNDQNPNVKNVNGECYLENTNLVENLFNL